MLMQIHFSQLVLSDLIELLGNFFQRGCNGFGRVDWRGSIFRCAILIVGVFTR